MTRARWALEELGLSYETKLIDNTVQESSDYRAQQPFGQVPVFEEDGLVLFESGSIVLHLGSSRSSGGSSGNDALLPTDPKARARAITWMFAALNSIEIHIQQLAAIDLFFSDKEWAKLRRPDVEATVKKRLGELATNLGDREYLEADRFTAGDLMMVAVLRILRHTKIVEGFPTLNAYRARCEARPAFQKALRDQMAVFEKHAPPK